MPCGSQVHWWWSSVSAVAANQIEEPGTVPNSIIAHTCCADQRQGPTLICAQRLPHAIGGCHDPITNQEFGAHKDQRARPADDPAPGFHKLADLNGLDEMHVELDGRLRFSVVSVPAGHSH